MPIYSYRCQCGNKQEKILPLGTGTIICTTCGAEMIRVLTYPALVLYDKSTPSERKKNLGTAPYS